MKMENYLKLYSIRKNLDLILWVFILFSLAASAKLFTPTSDPKKLTNASEETTPIVDTTKSTNDTVVSKKWLQSLQQNNNDLSIKTKTFTKGGTSGSSITFKTKRIVTTGGYIFSIEPVPSDATNDIKEITYASSDSEFRDHVLKSTDNGNNFYIEWKAKDYPRYLTLIVKHSDCKTDVFTLDYKNEKIIP